VAVAGGSKVCMSKKLIANKPSPNPLFFNNGLLKLLYGDEEVF